MDLKTRIEVLPCGKCEDMLDCDTCNLSKEAKELYKQIRAEVIDEVIRNISILIPFLSNEQLTAYFNICDKICELKENK